MKKTVHTIHNPSDLVNFLNLQDTVIIDLRPEEEFRKGHLPDAINLDIMKKNVEDFFLNLSTRSQLLVYCENGVRSRSVIKLLNHLGFRNIFSFTHTAYQWENQFVTY